MCIISAALAIPRGKLARALWMGYLTLMLPLLHCITANTSTLVDFGPSDQFFFGLATAAAQVYAAGVGTAFGPLPQMQQSIGIANDASHA